MRTIINSQLETLKNQKIAILFSGGMDSLSLLLSCLDLHIKPHVYSFRLSSHESQDIISVRKIINIFDLEYTEIVINNNLENLIYDASYIIKTFEVKKKTQVQCIHPFLYMVKEIKEKFILTGLCADDIYGTSRKMQVLGRKNELDFYEKRLKKHKDIESSSYKFIKELFKIYNKNLIVPYKENNKLVKLLLSKTYNELHMPKQKNLTYENYKYEIDKYDLYRRSSNLQVNSALREWHDLLLKTDLNIKEYKSVVGIYNVIYKNYMENKHDKI
ncbi:hypothetical protein IC213_18820 [Clostridioides sp. ES-S-0049-02]|uniref:asparagine synthase-related protein n=1 Tax=Clostridioides sp. ES-S-0049-02 TaxID=2770778 RepID=UPI001D11C8D3|nr:hypothetical protein [Clostridioides sp. ES-S-0049-02]